MTMGNINQTRGQQVMPEPTTKVRVSAKDELDVWVMGEGEPVVLVHGGMTRDLLTPLAGELATRGYQVIHYGRRGHGGGGLPGVAADIAGQVPDVVAILDALGIDRAHVAGHSFGAYITLDLTLRAPERVRSAVLLEPIFVGQVQTEASLQNNREMLEVVIPRLIETYLGGDQDGAVTMLWDATSGIENSAELLEPVLPEGTRELAATDLNTFIQVELPAMGSWTADPVAVKEMSVPVAWVGGADSAPIAAESLGLFREWLPTTRVAIVEGTGHYFPTLKPAETATALAGLLEIEAPTR
jgi:pimeloyl-ACP methyl ester carboxylesterase